MDRIRYCAVHGKESTLEAVKQLQCDVETLAGACTEKSTVGISRRLIRIGEYLKDIQEDCK